MPKTSRPKESQIRFSRPNTRRREFPPQKLLFDSALVRFTLMTPRLSRARRASMEDRLQNNSSSNPPHSLDAIESRMESQPAAVKRPSHRMDAIRTLSVPRYLDKQRRQICLVMETKIGLQSAVSQLMSLILLAMTSGTLRAITIGLAWV